MDPLDLAIVRGRLQQLTDEMDLVHSRAAFSPVVSEMNDRANSVIDARSGEVIVQGTTSLPIFVSTMQAAARAVLELHGDELRDGDVIVLNDPYLGGTHLQDVKMVRPFFVEGELLLLVVNTGHIVDVGGASAGGFDAAAVDIFQEGIQIPPTWLVREGRECDDVLRLILQNTRLPGPQEGDFRAQRNALDVGAERLRALVAERGADLLGEAVDELATRSEQQMRGYLRCVPDGRYEFVDHVETGDGGAFTLALALEFDDSDVLVDFTGTSPSYDGPMNLARHTAITAVLSAFKHLFPEVPINGGCFRPFTFRIPEDSLVDARRPRAVGGYVEGATRTMECVFGALAEALPDVVPAASFGTGGVLTLSGHDLDGEYYAGVFPMSGGYGASQGSDGLVHGPTPIGLANFPSLEASEHDYPIRWREYAIRPDSGGPGRWRGGPGTIFRIEVLTKARASFLGDRAIHPPFGVDSGRSGAPTWVEMEGADGRVGGPGCSRVSGARLRPGDVVDMRSAGGGGYGDVADRSPESLADDLADGVVTEPSVATTWRASR